MCHCTGPVLCLVFGHKWPNWAQNLHMHTGIWARGQTQPSPRLGQNHYFSGKS